MAQFRVLQSDTDEAQALIAAFCTAQDHHHVSGQLSEAARNKRLLARAATRELLFRHTGSYDWLLEHDALGKPFARDAHGAAGPHISFAHTQEHIAAAVDSAHPLGIDIEQWRPRNFRALAAYAFGPRECEEVAAHGAAAFYRIWSIREAMAKALGDGIIAHMNGTDQTPAHGVDDYADAGWHIAYHPLDGQSMAIAKRIYPTPIDYFPVAATSAAG